MPVLLTSAALRGRVHPDLSVASWRNWLHAAIHKHGFPLGLRVGARSVLWREDEVLAWLESRPRGGRFDGRRRGATSEPTA